MENQPQHCLCDGFNEHYRPDLIGIDSGFSQRDLEFQTRYELELPELNLECIRCCLLYLQRRRYRIVDGLTNFVVYPDLHLEPGVQILVPPITAFLNIPGGGGRRGQIATGHDLNLGMISTRAFASSRTYQMYSPTGTLSVGITGPSRMESVAIDVVQRHELKDIKVNYAVAVLIERYRLRVERPTLLGCCSIRSAQ